jgi:hypothetical protein
MLQKAMTGVGDVYTGATQGVESTLGNLGNLITRPFVSPDFAASQKSYLHSVTTPQNLPQAFGKGAEQVGEFMIPGGAEEKGALKLAELFPRLGKYAEPLAHVLTSAASSGSVNAAQGGSPVTGAALGAGGAVVGQGLKVMAPAIAEGALNIRKLDRAYGKGGGSIGRAILDETRGIRPGTVADSAEERLGELNPQLNQAVDRASMKPNPVRGLLTAPAESIPLAEPWIPDTPGELIPAARMPQGNITGIGNDLSSSGTSGRIRGVPGRQVEQLGSTAQTIPPRLLREAYVTAGEHAPQDIPTSGPGVWVRPAESEGGPIPSMIPNNSASLNPARDVLSHAFGTAARQGERTTAAQLQPMATHLGETMTGEPIPQNVTPRQLLDLKRGFGNEFIHRWNPETMTGVKGTAANTYHAMAKELNDTVPEAAGLNSRISNLIPVARRAESAELNAPTMQRAVNRFAAHTGALTGAGIGGAVGYKEGGLPGAVAGGLTGVFAPELIASPEGEMATARMLDVAKGLKPAVGAAAQFTRKRNDK